MRPKLATLLPVVLLLLLATGCQRSATGRQAEAEFRVYSAFDTTAGQPTPLPPREEAYAADTSIVAHAERGIAYEIGQLRRGGIHRKYLTVYEGVAEDRHRVLEIIATARAVPDYLAAIDKRREEWMRLCNAHDPAKLVGELYTEGTLYFNHKPLVRGREELRSAYRYMAAANYRLRLTPLVVEPVNERTVFEIGRCSGSYNGKYLLVWRRGADGRWRIHVDSNV